MAPLFPAAPSTLARLTHHRWALPILAELHDQRGSKFITLVNRLGAHRLAVTDALDSLINLGLVMPNPGYGHPMRPEYILTAEGIRAAPTCARLLERMSRARITDIGLRKWTLPTLLAVDRTGNAARFSHLREALNPATDRALAKCLLDSTAARLLARDPAPDDGRAVVYSLDRTGLIMREHLRELAA